SNKTEIYHEKQKLQFCLLHSLNNLFQVLFITHFLKFNLFVEFNYYYNDTFTRASLNATAERLVLDDPNKETKWAPLSLLFKPHHNAITGNYDINVLIAALEEKGKSVVWHDRRSGASAIDLDGHGGDLMGIVLNVPVRRYAGIWKGRHWITMREIDGVWYNLDSDLRGPDSFRDSEEVREFLDYVINHGGEVLLVKNDRQ
ncbi:LOW QUALITY PROTEIN: Josephin domain-containing protein, partial [Cephalotus follicularis]